MGSAQLGPCLAAAEWSARVDQWQDRLNFVGNEAIELQIEHAPRVGEGAVPARAAVGLGFGFWMNRERTVCGTGCPVAPGGAGAGGFWSLTPWQQDPAQDPGRAHTGAVWRSWNFLPTLVHEGTRSRLPREKRGSLSSGRRVECSDGRTAADFTICGLMLRADPNGP